MAIRPAEDERIRFSERLRECLQSEGYAFDSPTSLANEFNTRYAGQPVTVHAARKWLIGEAIPTQEKIRLLAQWLKVSAEWLRFGNAQHGEQPVDPVQAGGAPKPEEADFLDKLRLLNNAQRELLYALLSELAGLRQKPSSKTHFSKAHSKASEIKN